MDIIFGRSNAQVIKERYLVLELETLDAGGQPLECFCMVDPAVIPAAERPFLEHYLKLHQTLADNLKEKKYAICLDLIEHLLGKFGGELDSFYQTIAERINKNA